MAGNRTVGSWVAIREGCPIDYDVNGSTETDFALGRHPDAFAIVFEAERARAVEG